VPDSILQEMALSECVPAPASKGHTSLHTPLSLPFRVPRAGRLTSSGQVIAVHCLQTMDLNPHRPPLLAVALCAPTPPPALSGGLVAASDSPSRYSELEEGGTSDEEIEKVRLTPPRFAPVRNGRSV
jgi:hypothetical protein